MKSLDEKILAVENELELPSEEDSSSNFPTLFEESSFSATSFNLQNNPLLNDTIESFEPQETPPSIDITSPTGIQLSLRQKQQNDIKQFADLIKTYRYNHQLYELELFLDSSLGNSSSQIYNINPASVIALSISDQVDDWNCKGYIAFLYVLSEDCSDDSHFSGMQSSNIDKNNNSNPITILPNYFFRCDGFDILRFRLSLIATNSQALNKATSLEYLEIEPNNPFWTLNYTFSVRDFEDIVDVPGLKNQNSTFTKCLKVYFQDLRAEILQTSNIEYSTGETLKPTGKIIAEILEKAFSQNILYYQTVESLRLTTDPQHWDNGASELFYTSPTKRTAFEDIQYVYSKHVSAKKSANNVHDFCILTTERNGAKDNRYFDDLALKPCSSLFEQALDKQTKSLPGPLQLEKFFVDSFTKKVSINEMLNSTANSVALEEKTPSSFSVSLPFERNFTNARYSIINTFAFFDMSPETNQRLTTTPVYSFDFRNGNFKMEFEEHDIEKMKEAVGDLYIRHLFTRKKESSDPKELFLPVLNSLKRNVNVRPVFSPYGEEEYSIVRQSEGIQKLLKTGLFLNACICFSTLGLPLRRSGVFIGIDKTEGSSFQDDFANKLFGQWFVLRVEHIFTSSIYYNNIYAVKIYSYDKKRKNFLFAF